MNLSAIVAAAYVEFQRTTGRKPSLTSRFNRLRGRPVEADFALLRHLKVPDGAVIVDAGANRGETIASVRLFQPTAPIVAFEPNLLLHDIIRARNAGDRALTLHGIGLSDRPGQFELHVPYYKGVPFDGLASFQREEAAGFLNRERLLGFDVRHQTIRTFTCEVATLDRFALRPALIKIDVQGLEPQVIRGALATIRAHLPVVLMENNKPESDAADLTALGYVAHSYVGDRLIAGQIGALNTFYIHPTTRGMIAASMFG